MKPLTPSCKNKVAGLVSLELTRLKLLTICLMGRQGRALLHQRNYIARCIPWCSAQILTRKLGSESHRCSVVPSPLTTWPSSMQLVVMQPVISINPCRRTSWPLGSSRQTPPRTNQRRQFCIYAREVLCTQPVRRFFHAFTVCGHLARF